MPLALGDTIAGYTVIRELGVGGMGAVYLVRHPRLPRLVALKLLRPEFAADAGFVARFLHEAEIAGSLSHRNIVEVLDRDEDDGQLWLTMQYVDGVDAETALEQVGGLFPAERAVHVVSEVAAALDHAHEHHILHRDVKPANILLASGRQGDDPESVFLTDFGVAKALDGSTKLTKTGVVLATFDYASPEQIESAPLDARSDVYSLGGVLHRLLSGTVPYPGVTLAAAIHGHLSRPPPRPTDLVPWLPPAVDAVVAQAMAKDPADRYPTCRALAAAAARAVAEYPDPPPGPYTLTLRGGESGAAPVGPFATTELPSAEAEHLVDLLRRTRFFDLPEHLTAVGAVLDDRPAKEPDATTALTIDVAAGEVAHRVTDDPGSARRPPDLDELVATLQRLAARVDDVPVPAPGRAPATVIAAEPPAPPEIPAPRATGEGTSSASGNTMPTRREARPVPVAAASATGGHRDPSAPSRPRVATRRRASPPLSRRQALVIGSTLLVVAAAIVLVVVLVNRPSAEQIGDPLGGHSTTVDSVVFSPDGRVLASGGDDGSVRLWDVSTHQQREPPLDTRAPSVVGVVFSPDGQLLASAAGSTVQIWDAGTRRELGAPLTGHEGSVNGVAFSPDGAVVASGGEDGTVRLWDLGTRQELGAPLTGHDGSVNAVAFSPGGAVLASAGKDGTVRLWDVATRQELGAPLTGNVGAVYEVAFSHDGAVVASAGYDNTVRLWDVATRQSVGELSNGDFASVKSIAFSPDGKTMAAGSEDDLIRLWDLGTRQQLGDPLTGHKGDVDSVAFSPDGHTLASGGSDNTIRLWDVQNYGR